MLIFGALLFAQAPAIVSVHAYVPPRCGYEVVAQAVQAHCNAQRWSVVAIAADGSEAIIRRSAGVGCLTLPKGDAVSFRIDLEY